MNPLGLFLTLVVIAIAVLSACSAGSEAEPDTVVGIVWRCPVPGRIATARPGLRNSPRNSRTVIPTPIPQSIYVPATEIIGDPCRSSTATTKRQELTVRSSQGGSYVIDAPVDLDVALGDVWPPAP